MRGFSQAIPASLASSSLAPGDIITVSGAKRTADFALRHTDPKRDHRPQRAAGTLLAVRHRHPRRRHPERRHLPARRLHTANSPTYLALFATGLNLSPPPVVAFGGVPVKVVFFGAAPCCDGLDQINIALPDSLAWRRTCSHRSDAERAWPAIACRSYCCRRRDSPSSPLTQTTPRAAERSQALPGSGRGEGRPPSP